jgi:hypothetical protein
MHGMLAFSLNLLKSRNSLPKLLCSKIHSSSYPCLPKFSTIFWDFSNYFYHQNLLLQFLILLKSGKSIFIEFSFPTLILARARLPAQAFQPSSSIALAFWPSQAHSATLPLLPPLTTAPSCCCATPNRRPPPVPWREPNRCAPSSSPSLTRCTTPSLLVMTAINRAITIASSTPTGRLFAPLPAPIKGKDHAVLHHTHHRPPFPLFELERHPPRAPLPSTLHRPRPATSPPLAPR